MGSLSHAVSHGARILISAALVLWLLVHLAVASRAAQTRRVPQESVRTPVHRRVVLLRPCAGQEDYLSGTLLSSRAAGQGARVRFLLATDEDEASAPASEAAATLRSEGIDAQVLITHASRGNRKACQLAAAELASRGEASVFVVADADVMLTPELISELLAPLDQISLGATWAPPIERSGRTLGDLASQSILDASLHAFRLLAQLDPKGMVGKCFAIRGDLLAEVGGFAQLSDVLGEDMELARRLHASGYRTEPVAICATSCAEGRTMWGTVQRYARWISVIRYQRGHLFWSYPLLFAAAPLQLVCAIALAMQSSSRGALLVGAVLAVRCAIAVLARRRSGSQLRGLALGICLADFTLLAAWVMVLVGAPLRWRGVPLHFADGGHLRDEVRP